MPDLWASNPSCSLLLASPNVNALPFPFVVYNSRADLRITADHPIFAAQPYSFQYGGCQISGMPINVSMALEWSHYRYGVFDEGRMPDVLRHPSQSTQCSRRTMPKQWSAQILTPSSDNQTPSRNSD